MFMGCQTTLNIVVNGIIVCLFPRAYSLLNNQKFINMCIHRRKNVQSLNNNDNDSNIIKLMDMLYISYMLLKMVNNKLLVTEKSISDLCCRLQKLPKLL